MGQIAIALKGSLSSTFSWLVSLGVLAAVCTSCRGSSPPAKVTFHEDVAPILYAQCIGCHRSGGIAPFPLTDYVSAKANAAAIASTTAVREMPPMPVNGSGTCNLYENARWLDDSEIATLADWVAAGAPEGDPRMAPAMPPLPASPDAPDAVVDIGVTYTPAGTAGHEDDDYRCFVAPGPVSAAAFLVGFEMVPGDARVVHHVIAYQPGDDEAVAAAHRLDAAADGSGYTCFGGPGVDAAPVALWAPGSGAVRFPPGTGLALAANRPWIIQIHYNLAQGVFPDRTRVNLHLAQGPIRPAVFAPVADVNLRLPPGLASARATAATAQDPTAPYTVYGAAPHMHTLGRTMRVDVSNNLGPTCLVDVDRWDFHWQNIWWYEQPIHVVAPQSISIRCDFDTTTRTDTVTWGEGTSDEMCISYFYLVPEG